MSDATYEFLLSMSISIPFAVCIIRFQHIPLAYHPLMFVVSLGLVNEIITYCFFRKGNAVPTNIYNLAEYLLYCWQFRNWKHILRGKLSFYLITGSVVLFWIIDQIVLGKLNTFTSFFMILYSFLLVLHAVNELNFLVANEHGNVLKNSIFLFSAAMIIFYAYRILSEVFYRYTEDHELQNKIFDIQAYLNVLFNILLTLVILWIPKKRVIILR
jgi:hypothetical protein